MRNATYILILSLAGCVSVAPDLKIPDPCSRLAMPPVPQKMSLVIDGDKITADGDGESFLRYYVQARLLLR